MANINLVKATAYINATIITMDADRRVIPEGGIVVLDNRITFVGDAKEIQSFISFIDHKSSSTTAIIDLDGAIILPGLINTHAHLTQSLLRGLAEDLPLHNWLCDAIWPLEASYQADEGYVAARLTIGMSFRMPLNVSDIPSSPP